MSHSPVSSDESARSELSRAPLDQDSSSSDSIQEYSEPSNSQKMSPLAEDKKQKKAKAAYLSKDHATSIAIHDAAKGNAKEKHRKGGDFIKSMVYGGLDGIITTFAVVAGAAGGDLGVPVVLVMGFSNLVADGLSMGLGDYLSSKAEGDYAKAERKRELWEFENYAEGEKAEMVEIYESRGMTSEDAKELIDILAKYKHIFIDTMMVEELGLMPPDPKDSPWKNGMVTFASFFVCGLVPLLAYIITEAAGVSDFGLTFGLACGLTAMMLFALGAVSSRFTIVPWWKSGLLYLLIGGVAAACSYLVGMGVSALVNEVNPPPVPITNSTF